MTVRRKHLTIAGAVGAVALTVGGLTSPALAASHDITYNCNKGNPAALGPIDTTLTTGAVPAKLVAGQKSKGNVTVVVHLSPQQAALAASLGTSVSGSIKSKGVDSLNLTIPSQSTTPAGDGTLDVTANGKGTISSAAAGKVKVSTGTINAVLKLSIDASSSCKMPTDGTQVLGTTTVSKDKSKSKVSGKVKAKKATVTDKITSKFGVKATGKVGFTFKKGSKTVKASGKISKKGVATVTKTLTSGKWSVTAQYKGNKGLKGSTGKGSVTIK
jgi:hypothetical protein